MPATALASCSLLGHSRANETANFASDGRLVFIGSVSPSLPREGKTFTGANWLLSCRLVHSDTEAGGKSPELNRLGVAIVAPAVASLSQNGVDGAEFTIK